MPEKIRVNLSLSVYDILMEDMYTFCFFKPNGDLNRNAFLTKIIENMYGFRDKKRKTLGKVLIKNAFVEGMSDKQKNMFFEASIDVLDQYYFEDYGLRYHPFSMTITPTRESEKFFDFIEENEVRNKTDMSAYLRRILNEYAFFPREIREQVVKIDEFRAIHDAILYGRAIVFKIGEINFRIAPFDIILARDGSNHYLLGIDLASKNRAPICIRLFKINGINLSKENFSFTKEEKEKLIEIIKRGVEFATSEFVEVKIRLTNKGEQMLDYLTHLRPSMKLIDEKTKEWVVVTTDRNFMDYFVAFGKEMKIVENENMEKKMKKFYEDALKQYEGKEENN